MYKVSLFIKRELLGIILILYGCSPEVFVAEKTPIADRSFVTSENCISPCWYDLRINQSTKEDALSTLDKLSFVDIKSYKEYETYRFDNTLANAISYNCLDINAQPCGYLTFYRNILKKNWITVNFDLKLESVISRLGTPDFLVYFWPNPSGRCDVSVTWLEKGTSVEFKDDKKYNECESIIDGNGVSPEILVETITYFSEEILQPPSTYQEAVVNA